MSEASNTPEVRAFPPLVYLVSILIGAGIQWLVPLRPFPAGVTHWAGGALMLAALGIVTLAVREFSRAKTTFRVDRETRRLVTTGPMRWSRNPGYVALATLQAGLGIWLNNIWIVALLLPTVPMVTRLIIIPEERYLTDKFGLAYEQYRAEVRRWL